MTKWKPSPVAAKDLLDVYTYGVERFGRAAAIAYLQSLHSCFERLVLNPQMGRPADTAGDGVRRIEHRKHVVFYEIETSGVRIVAVIHERSIRGIKG